MALEVIARAKVREGQLKGFKAQAAEIVRVSREQDTHTLRCDWFINQDGSECEVHEMFPDEQGLIEHSMHIMEVRAVLFRGYAYDHQATLYGDVSPGLINLVTERMGAPTVFSFLQGLDESAAVWPPAVGVPRPDAVKETDMAHLEVTAHLRIRPGQLEGFKTQVAEIMRLTREQDTQTLRYDWFINEDGTECEVHEAYVSAEGLIEHNAHVQKARALLFEKFAYDHRMSVYGEISQHLRDLFNEHAGGVSEYSFLDGLETAPAV
jgi:quinol monooxygenase YgiN